MADLPDYDVAAHDAPALPGKAQSWAPGEPLPKDPNEGLGLKDDAPPKALVEGLTRQKQEDISFTDRLGRTMSANYDRDRARMEREFDAEHLVDVKPWDAEAESRKRQSDPISDFASLGSAFGILASAFTHAPMANGIGASAAAINAIKENNAEDYRRAYDAYKENVDVAFKRADLERRRFQDASTLMKENTSAGLSMARLHAVESDDKKSLLMLENGMIPEWEDYKSKFYDVKGKAAEAALKQAKDMAIMQDRMDLIGNYKEEFKAKNGREITPIEMQHAMPGINRQWLQETSPYRAAGTSGMIEQRTQAYYEDPDSPTHGNLLASQDRALKEIKTAGAVAKKETPTEKSIRLGVEEYKTQHEGKEPPKAVYDQIVRDAPKPQTEKSATTAEETRIALAPSLMTDLDIMNKLINEGTGAFTGKLKEAATKIFGVNDPVAVFNAAHADAESKVASLQTRGSSSVLAIKHALDTLPAISRASEFGRKQLSIETKNLREETQSIVSTMLAGGKKIDPYNLERLHEMGVYPGESQQKDPILKLDKDPSSVSDDELKTLFRSRASYPDETRQKISSEILRRTGVQPAQQ